MLGPQEPSREEQPKVKTILIVEDDPAIGELFALVLQQETPYHALLVPDGFHALEMVRRLSPDLFMFDYQLPGMNGIELYDHLHSTKGLEDIPALFLSANMPVEELEKRQVSFLNKPVELDELLQAVEKLLAQ